jgi:hypothetical protein
LDTAITESCSSFVYACMSALIMISVTDLTLQGV